MNDPVVTPVEERIDHEEAKRELRERLWPGVQDLPWHQRIRVYAAKDFDWGIDTYVDRLENEYLALLTEHSAREPQWNTTLCVDCKRPLNTIGCNGGIFHRFALTTPESPPEQEIEARIRDEEIEQRRTR